MPDPISQWPPVIVVPAGDDDGNNPGPFTRSVFGGNVNRTRNADISAAGLYIYGPTVALALITGGNSGFGIFFQDPDDHRAPGTDVLYRLDAAIAVNDTAPAATFSPALYPVSTIAGPANTTTTITVGAAVAESAVPPFVNPAANSLSARRSSALFAPPAAGIYAIGFDVSAVPPANCGLLVFARLVAVNV